MRGELKEEVTPSPADTVARTSSVPDLPMEFSVDVDGEVFDIKVTSVLGKTTEVEKPKRHEEPPPGAVVSPIHGMVLVIKVKVGDKVKEGDTLLIIEAMKMQNQVSAPHSGLVRKILTFQGELVNTGDVLMLVEPQNRSAV